MFYIHGQWEVVTSVDMIWIIRRNLCTFNVSKTLFLYALHC